MNTLLVWAEVDLDAIAHNVRTLRRITDPTARLMAVVKANGYGHGAAEVARTALHNGAEALGVARIQEGIDLREQGFDAPILIFGYGPPDLARKLLEFDLTQTVYSLETAKALSQAALSAGKKIRVHLKVDTGMGRLGMLPQCMRSALPDDTQSDQVVNEVMSIARLPALHLEGIYMHFAAADSHDKSYARLQLDRFMEFLNQLRREGLEFSVTHAANSAGIMEIPEAHLDMVRAGISIYGLYPSHEVDKSRVTLRPAMALKARIVHLKQVGAGFKVSYGMTYQTLGPTTIATVPIGYADGLNRLLSSRGHMLVRGSKAPVLGRVCMDLTMLDVGHISGVGLEDEVVIFGNQGEASITVDEIAQTLGTINYEIVSTITDRVPRIYLNQGREMTAFA